MPSRLIIKTVKMKTPANASHPVRTETFSRRVSMRSFKSAPVFHWLRWLAPVSAVGLVVFVSVYQFPWAIQSGGLKADEVELNHRLVSSFDAVAELPDGEPVRFRVREWSDESVFHDSARGLVVERNTPRLEVVPVAFETY